MSETGKIEDEIVKDESIAIEKKSTVLVVDEKNEDGSEKIKPDERFFMDEDDEKGTEDEKPKKALGKDFKKDIKKENKKAKIAFVKKRFVSFLGMATVSVIFRLLDFLLNLFSISAIVFGVAVTANFLMEGNAYMVVAGCVFIFISIYLNEKIS